MPGTGKSHTVAALLGYLAQNTPQGSLPPLTVHVNCMVLTDPTDVYAALLRGVQAAVAAGGAPGRVAPVMSSTKQTSQAAYESLVALLHLVRQAKGPGSKAAGKGSSSSRASGGPGHGRLVVLVLDEVDRLADKAHEDLYRLFMMPHMAGAWARGGRGRTGIKLGNSAGDRWAQVAALGCIRQHMLRRRGLWCEPAPGQRCEIVGFRAARLDIRVHGLDVVGPMASVGKGCKMAAGLGEVQRWGAVVMMWRWG